MKVCIIGGGLAGLAAGWHLKERHEVDIYEKRGELGGCLSSYQIGDYWIEQFYHHFFAGDTCFLSLADQLGLSGRLEWLRGTSGYCVGDTIYPLNTPLEVLRYPFLSLADKARLALLTVRSKRMDASSLDSITAKEFIISNLGGQVYDSFFEPLLRGKFGDLHETISAAWLIGRVSIRSNRGISGERLGYMTGGFHTFINELSDQIGRHCIVRLHDPVTSLIHERDEWRVNERRYDAVISTIPPQALQPSGGPDLPPVPYQGAACLTMGLDQEYAHGMYWLNMKDPGPFGAVVTHTNFAPYDRYGEHIVYLASYYMGELPHQAGKAMRETFCRKFHVPESAVHWDRLAVEPLAGPLFRTGYRDLIVPYQARGLFWAGMFSPDSYPERSMNGSIAAGYAAAAALERGEDHP